MARACRNLFSRPRAPRRQCGDAVRIEAKAAAAEEQYAEAIQARDSWRQVAEPTLRRKPASGPAAASNGLAHEHVLLYMLAIPALVPTALASYSVVGERQQGTLEPVLATPIRREGFPAGKALAALVPSLAISYAVLALFLGWVELFAQPGIASALLQAPDLLAQLLFTPLLALNVIHATLGLALGGAALLLVLDTLGWRITSATFDRERLITGTR
jgi:ABC-type Na+ efflux pump permease subunit